MDRNGLLAVFFFIFIISDASSASLLSNRRILIGETSNDNSTVPDKESPVPSPPPPPTPNPVSSSGDNGSDPKPVDDPTKKKTESVPPAKNPNADPGPKDLNNGTKTGEGKDPKEEKKDPTPAANKGSKEDPNPVPDKGKEDTNPVPEKKKELGPNAKPNHESGSGSAPPEVEKGKSKEDLPEGGKGKVKDTGKKKKDDVTNSPDTAKESCDGVIKTCKVKDVAVACIKSSDNGSKKLAILVQNVGDHSLKAKLSAGNTSMDLEIAKHENRKVNIPLGTDKSTKITLHAGDEDCELHTDIPLPEDNFFLRLPSYESVLTPTNGAYLLIVTVVILGGIWACCLVRKRKQRTGGGVPYQELEMGLPESVSATAVETAEGWDQGWDDDWDGDMAVKSPGTHIVGSISSNGLTSRAANKDGWENDWDD